MAKKRALVDAALSASRLSDIFTQDIEDWKDNTEGGGEGGGETPATDQYYCQPHKTKWFKSGNMRGYAHKIAGTDKWCNMPDGSSLHKDVNQTPPAPEPAQITTPEPKTAVASVQGQTQGQAELMNNPLVKIPDDVLMRQQSILTLARTKSSKWTADKMAQMLGNDGVDWNQLTNAETDRVLDWLNAKAPSPVKK